MKRWNSRFDLEVYFQVLDWPAKVRKGWGSEGPEKTTKGEGVNGSQSKFLTGILPIS
jgi:hypothetical protein